MNFSLLERLPILVILFLPIAASNGQVIAPSTYTNAITVNGETPGNEFADWSVAGIPIALTDAADNPGGIDINTIQIANDDDFLYLRVTYHGTLSAGTFLGFDTDQDPATGFDLFGLGVLGSELGYVNDFPFAQDIDVFNNGSPLTGGPIGNGGALIYPAFNVDGNEREWAVPRSVAYSNPAGPAFSGDTFNFWVWTDTLLGDVPDEAATPTAITYTFAASTGIDGDFNDDTVYDCADVDALVADIASGSNSSIYDLTGDGSVTTADLDAWLAEAGEANLGPGKVFLGGDATLDGNVNGADFVAWNNSKFTSTAAWCSGDFSADGSVNGGDFVVWNSNKFTSSDLQAVPEPTGLMALLVGLMCFLFAA